MAKEKTAFGSRKCKALLAKRDQVERLISFGLFDDAPDDLTDLTLHGDISALWVMLR